MNHDTSEIVAKKRSGRKEGRRNAFVVQLLELSVGSAATESKLGCQGLQGNQTLCVLFCTILLNGGPGRKTCSFWNCHGLNRHFVNSQTLIRDL